MVKMMNDIKKVLEEIELSIYTEHRAINNMDNSEYEKGVVNGLINAANIVRRTLKAIEVNDANE